MVDKAKSKRGRPPKQAADLHPARVVFMADELAQAWLKWRAAETGAPISEIMRRALAFYMAANPAPTTRRAVKKAKPPAPAEPTAPLSVEDVFGEQ